jgi:hypothetical protein
LTRATLRQFLTSKNLDVLQCRGAGHCLAAKSQQVGERHVLLFELLKQLSLTATAAIGAYPDDKPLAIVIRSGTTPNCSVANIVPLRPNR